LVRGGGRIVLAGLKSGKPVNGLVTDKIVAGELQVLGGFSSTSESLLTALEILKTHQHRLDKICSHSFGLDAADLAVRTLGREVEDGTDVLHVTIVVAR
jgi:threonine dehydrogenase-like Zn-dependent dehydrogenase